MTTIESRIDSVRLHRTGAVVTRRASVPSGPAVDEIRVAALPISLDDSTLRITPSAGASMSELRVAIDLVEPVGGGETIDEKALRSLEQEEARLRAELATLGRARLAIEKVTLPRRAARSDGATPPADSKARAAFSKLRAEQLRALFSDEHKLSSELVGVVKRRAALADALAKTVGSRPPDPMSLRKTAAFRLVRGGEGAVEIELSYFVPGARWAPSYALRIDKAGSRAAIELRAAVCQSTGEDWGAVQVSLSTAEAMRFHELQELTSLRIGRAQAPKKKLLRPVDDPAELFADFDRAMGGPSAASPEPEPEPEPEELGEIDELTAAGFGAPPAPGAMMMPASFGPPPQASTMVTAMAMPMAPPFNTRGMSIPASRSRRMASDAVALPRKGGFRLFGATGGGGGGEETVEMATMPGGDPELELDERLFAFESLRMPPPEARKGRLTLVTPVESYLESSRSLSHARGDQVAVLLIELRRATERALATDPPRRHVLPNDESGFHHVLDGEHRVDVPADGAFHSLPLLRAEVPLTIRHVAVPRESTDVFRLASFKNPLGSPLLAGPCDVYVDDDFLLTVDMPTVPIGGDARVGLGVDQAIKVVRNTHFSEQTQGLMGGSLLLKHRIEIDVVSHLERPALLEVRERVPSAQEKDEDVKVEIGDVSPAWQKWEAPANEPGVRGAFAWRIELAPQQPVELRASYTVRIPSKLELVGGNRRD